MRKAYGNKKIVIKSKISNAKSIIKIDASKIVSTLEKDGIILNARINR